MPIKLTGRDGILKVLDSTDVIARKAEANMSVFVYDSSGLSFTDKTSDAYADDTNYTGAFWADTNDKIYIGQTAKFARIKFVKSGGAYGVGAGALVAKYYNGSTWATLTVVDGTASGGHSMAQDGIISFQIPSDWALGGDAALSATHYYIELSPTDVPSVKPSADVLAPVDGQYFEVIFAGMDFNGPLGRPLTEELLIMDRQRMDSNAHYLEDADDALFAALPISFSCILDDTVNREFILAALQCGHPDSTDWTEAGVSSKGDTKNDGTNSNPTFVDTGKKTVNIQMLWDGPTFDEGMAYYEVYINQEQTTIAESADGVILSVKGSVFGAVEGIYAIANRY